MAHAAGSGVAVTVCLILGMLTWRQSGNYADQERLYGATLAAQSQVLDGAQQPRHMAHAPNAFRRGGRAFPRGTANQTDFAMAHFNLGTALGLQGRQPEAIVRV